MKVFIIFAVIFFSMASHCAIAQENEPSLQEYTPPPLFGAPRFPENNKEPQAEEKEQQPRTEKPDNKNHYAPRVSKQVDLSPPNKAPLPPKRPKEIVSKAVLEKQKEKPASFEDKEKPSQGVVKGPKTMPAVKAKSVEVETTGEEIAEEQTKMLERVQEEKKEQEQAAALEKREPKDFKILDISKPNIIIFEPGAVALNEQQKDALEFAVIPTLEKSGAKLQIQSFASPANDSFSSDRRISLSRALAVRSFLLEKGFDPSKIQLRALGAETNKQPFDRIELIFG